jgi:hypothetical protein
MGSREVESPAVVIDNGYSHTVLEAENRYSEADARRTTCNQRGAALAEYGHVSSISVALIV